VSDDSIVPKCSSKRQPDSLLASALARGASELCEAEAMQPKSGSTCRRKIANRVVDDLARRVEKDQLNRRGEIE
jgi:hypothetical protein